MPDGSIPSDGQIAKYLKDGYIKSVNLVATVTLPALPSGNAGSTVGVTSGHGSSSINLTTLSGFPTGKTILGVFPQIGQYTSANYVRPYLFAEGTIGYVYGRPGFAYSVSFKVIYLDI